MGVQHVTGEVKRVALGPVAGDAVRAPRQIRNGPTRTQPRPRGIAAADAVGHYRQRRIDLAQQQGRAGDRAAANGRAPLGDRDRESGLRQDIGNDRAGNSRPDHEDIGLDIAAKVAARQQGQPAGFPDGSPGAQIAVLALQGCRSPVLFHARKRIALQQAGQMRRIGGEHRRHLRHDLRRT